MPKKIKDVHEPHVALALVGHPYRVAIMAALEQRETASPKDLANELGVPVEKLSYHFRVLRDADAIELVRMELAGGSVKRLYRLKHKPHISPAAWAALPEFAKEVIAGNSLEHLWRVTMAAAATGCITRDEAIVGRFPVRVDKQGFKEVEALLKDTIAKIKQIEQEAAGRIDRHEAFEEPATVIAMLFDTPDPAAVMAFDREPERRPSYRRRPNPSSSTN